MIKRKTKILGIALIVLAISLLLLSGFVLMAFQKKNSTEIDFQGYKPTSLPDDIAIANRSVDVWSDKTNPFSYHKIATLKLSKSHSYISQQKTNEQSLKAVLCDTRSSNVTCQVLITPKGQNYMFETVFTARDKLTPSSQTVRWIKGDTYLWAKFDIQSHDTYTQDDMSDLIDSMVPVSFEYVSVKHYSPGP